MSIRPELPYIGTPTQRLTQRMSDHDRVLARLRSGPSDPIVRGTQALTFTAQNSLSFTVTAPRATGNAGGLASAGLIGAQGLVCSVQNNANGTVTIYCYTASGATVTGSTTVFYEVWSY